MGAKKTKRIVIAQTKVSIHAPVMVANLKKGNPVTVIGVSIHAPVMGANSEILAAGNPVDVSIHAPVMGANPQATNNVA
tara:strand:- start:236 stop:472 length:237 start_codon:yes stop_codon:yes gene_type:complete